jgi:hypothetical protein
MFPYLLISSAWAATVNGGIQVAAFPSALEFAGEALTGQTLNVSEDEVSGADVACYDTVGIQDFNVAIPLDAVDLEYNDDTLIVDIHFGRIHGEGMILFGSDDDTWDACPSFDTAINSVSLERGRLLVEFAAGMSDGEFILEIVETPTFTGDLETDIDWVPDALVLAFVEDTIFDTVEDLIVERVPEIAMGLLGNSLYAGQIGDIELDVQLSDVQMQNALMIGMDVDAAWLGEGCPVSGILEEPGGLSPRVDFGNNVESDIAVAITEHQINRLFFGAWEDGLLCFEAGPLYAAVETIEDLLGETIPNSDVELSFNRAPQFQIDDGRMTMVIDGLHLGVFGDVNGEQQSIVGLDASLRLAMEIRVDRTLSSFVFDLTSVDLDLETLVADPLISDRDAVSERLIAFLEGWAMATLADRIADVPLYGNLFEMAGIFLRVDQTRATQGAVQVFGTLYESDDPEVDTEPPDTQARISKANASKVHLAWNAVDNRDGPFAYSWRIDSGSWSYWSSEDGDSFATPDPGEHIIEVRARDAWLNVDLTPSVILFEVDTPADKNGCGCASTRGGMGALPVFLCALFLGVGRRRE